MTGHIPQSFIESLLARADIVEIIGERVRLKRAGANFIGCCPFHTEKTPSFSVNPSKQFYHCFGCGVSGDALRFLMEHDGLHFVEAVESLASRLGVSVPTETGKTPSANYLEIYAMLAEASLFYQAQLRQHPQANKAVTYLKARGITGQTAKQFAIGYAPTGWDGLLNHLGTTDARIEDLIKAGLVIRKEDNRCFDRFRDRILFPIRDRRGRVVGFGGRIIDVGEPKYLNSPETAVFNKGSELYGLYEARLTHRSLTNLIVVEGYVDVVSLVQAGITQVVAALGTALTDKHVDVLFNQASELTFCFDGDKAGRAAAKRVLPLILPHMKEGRRVRFVLLPEGMDPDSLVRKQGAQALLDQLQHAIPLSDFLFDTLSAQLDLNHLDGRAQLVSLAKPFLALLPSGIFQQMMLDRLAELAQIQSHVLQEKRKSYNSSNVQNRTSAIKNLPSPAYHAVALLLAKRDLIAHLINLDEFMSIDAPGMALLCAIIHILRIEPTISNEAILSQLSSDCKDQYKLFDLKRMAESVPEAGIEQEFLGAMQRLRERVQEQAMESLLIKAKTGVLSSSEKAHLRNLLDEKEKRRTD